MSFISSNQNTGFTEYDVLIGCLSSMNAKLILKSFMTMSSNAPERLSSPATLMVLVHGKVLIPSKPHQWWNNSLICLKFDRLWVQRPWQFNPKTVIGIYCFSAKAKKKNMCVYGHPTHSIFQPPTLTFFISNYSILIFANDPINFYTEFG